MLLISQRSGRNVRQLFRGHESRATHSLLPTSTAFQKSCRFATDVGTGSGNLRWRSSFVVPNVTHAGAERLLRQARLRFAVRCLVDVRMKNHSLIVRQDHLRAWHKTDRLFTVKFLDRDLDSNL